MNIYLIRHGDTEEPKETDFNFEKQRPDHKLSERGVIQAQKAAVRLQECNIQKIYCSDLSRALNTACIINAQLGVDLVIRPELREIDMGELHFKSWKDVQKENPEFYAQWFRYEADLPYPSGECGADVLCRIMQIIDEIFMDELENVAVVTHGGVIRVLTASIMGMELEQRFTFDIDHCSITCISYDKETNEFYLGCVNDCSHWLCEQL